MKKLKPLLSLAIAFFLCFSIGITTSCKNNEQPPAIDQPSDSEQKWQDENVDNNGWT